MVTPTQQQAHQIKYEIIVDLGGICIDCQTDLKDHLEIADFDHVRDVKAASISELITKAAGASSSEQAHEALADELKKCDLVCANCHRIRTTSRNSDKDYNSALGVSFGLSVIEDPASEDTAPDLARRAPWHRQVLCACGCGIAFKEEPRVGAPKRYIDSRHARRQAMRTYRDRIKDGARIWEDRQCRRYVPKSLKEAEKSFRLHCEYSKVGSLHCTKSTPSTSLRCPAVFHRDYECQQNLCIAYGTLLDDLMEWKMQGRYQRRYTTIDGFWLTDVERADALNDLPEESKNPWDQEGIYG